ncbi:dTDP-4-dehydrorhamnose 3,5-epimerase family protein [Rhodococcus pyridinivorans]|uniref:dTDP-4-dehydrorhamnose 3,5-epimerase family protein n=1 Tax=Rhodococcus pyridinivorans TaxID=103816 RepID=UPI0020788CC1|nr:dTDP-4-dehydrorhamnose 3,5-epimerase [Rhodococcus pyridinivorans]USI92501.1 dTDP-4-dehydrorhamnose 3,5-epimerase [Rhodococcus pyridinivorans]
MRVETTELLDVRVFRPVPFPDDRGLFTRTFDARIFDEVIGPTGVRASDLLQDSQSRSVRGVVRGMHGRSGRGEAKLVRCAHGAVHDVLVDIRRDSPTFGRHQVFRLDDIEFAHLFVPPGFLHGFQALTDTADVCYRIDREHNPVEDIAVRYDDPDLAIVWPLPLTVLSARDGAAGSWRDLLAAL